MIRIKKGLDLPILGTPTKSLSQTSKPKRVALLGGDYMGMKPSMMVKEGDQVKKGEVLFTDKKQPEVKFTSPGGGKIIEVNRGERRVFQSVVIELDDNEEEVTFESFSSDQLSSLDEKKAKEILIESGVWTSIRTRPFSKIANPESSPEALFVNAMDTNPLGIDPAFVIKENMDAFKNGLQVISKIHSGKNYLCMAEGNGLDLGSVSPYQTETFSGPHPAGNVGTHIHYLHPATMEKEVWYIGYADVIAIGNLFSTGKIDTNVTIALGGNQVNQPRYLQTRRGACLVDILNGELKPGENRMISGSVLSGHHAYGPFQYLGRYHQQVSVVREGKERKFLGWMKPGMDMFSIKRIYCSSLTSKKYEFHTNTNGGPRAMVPVGSYEKVMPFDTEPTFLLRALLTKDTDQAQLLGCMELDEEDLALCTFVCPSKYDYGKILRENLTIIEKEG